ncbi:TAXI family TRAP transporter solute-binding subunit [uncultured Ruegeria sp.]|uniref:TAXI family TRAP transporter solute-binding subunit n=1 Tax=uncultured Ruegeria sp. TaxID=259304 RepID=UPI002601FB94|nr:TAXI family TRAP transporter solute-binding subunit [uncultured Ruegeria sp.]
MNLNFTKSAILAASVLIGSATLGEARELKAESASPAGLTSVVLQVTARDLAGSDTSISLNTGQTLTRTALKLAAGKIDVGIVPPGAFGAMKKGVGPYKENPDQAKELSGNLRSLYSFIGGSVHPIVRADSGIESWDDIAGKRVFVGPPGGAANRQLTSLVRVMTGLEPDTGYDAVKMGWGAAGPAFQDGQFDVYLASTAVGSASLVQLFLQGDYRFLPAPDGVADSETYAAMLVDNGSVTGGVPAGAYEGVENGDQNIDTYAYTMLVSVNKDMSDDEAYLLTKTFWDNLDANKEEIAVLLTVEKVPFAGNNMLLHPGAIRYYEEIGLDVPSELIAN